MFDVEHLCPGCMGHLSDRERPCPRCGFSWKTYAAGSRELAPFTIIGGRYLLGVKIGTGGFGITYIAMDLAAEKPAAIKEFFPASLAGRAGDRVEALPGEEGRYFRDALRAFRKEAELLSRFTGVEGIVPYRDYVTENGTAYLVMDYVEGVNLKQYMKQTGKTFSQEEALSLMKPILLAVEQMHRQKVLHRDISPENLILKPDGRLLLIDFGAAREYSLDEDENLTVILKHGYAPEEQYHSGSRQGPWTDLYACCAVLYQMVSGILPQDGASRSRKDDLLSLDEIEGLSVTERFARVIEKGMTIHATERYASIKALMKALYPEEKQPEADPGTEGRKADTEPAATGPEHKDERPTTDRPAKPAAKKEPEETEENRFAIHMPENRESGRSRLVLSIVGFVAAVFILVYLFRPRGAVGPDASGGAGVMPEDGVVWLATYIDAGDGVEKYEIEYNESGYYERIISYGTTEAPYAYGWLAMGSTAVDPSYGPIVSDFTYSYGPDGRIADATQTTDTGITYHAAWMYASEDTMTPETLYFETTYPSGQIGASGTVRMDEEGKVLEIETDDGGYPIVINFDYSGGREGVTQISQRVYCVDVTDYDSVRAFFERYYGTGAVIYGVDYGIGADGLPDILSWSGKTDAEGHAEVYAEICDSSPGLVLEPVRSVRDLYACASDQIENNGTDIDAYGNPLSDANGAAYYYEEYEVEDGVFTPTGRASGTAPDLADHPSGSEGTDRRSYVSLNDQPSHMEILDLFAQYGFNGDSEEYPQNFAKEEVKRLVFEGNLDCAIVQVSTDMIGTGHDGFYVFPPRQWFLDDETAWTLYAYNGDIGWNLTWMLMDEGYYSPDDTAYDFFQTLQTPTGDLVFHATTSFRYEMAEQYLYYWSEADPDERTWMLFNDETGEQSAGLYVAGDA